MIELTISADDMAALRLRLCCDGLERCATVFATQVSAGSDRTRLLVCEIDFPDDSDYAAQSNVAAELRPEYVAKVSRQARRASQSLIFVHSHVAFVAPRFSVVDDEGERLLGPF